MALVLCTNYSKVAAQSAQKVTGVPNMSKAEIAQYLDRQGDYVVVGDMLIREDHFRAGVTGTAWPGANVYYYFDSNISESEKALFRLAASRWEAAAGFRFFETGPSGNRIKIKKPNESYCNSYVGMQGGEQELNLGPGCWWEHVIVHELGHAIGMRHEQNRSDSASYVSYVSSGGGTPGCNALIAGNWGPINTQNLTVYDYASIMHYTSRVTGLTSAQCTSGVSVTMSATQAQPAGAPGGSENACSSPAACTALMGMGTRMSLRDEYGNALRYGYRMDLSIAGEGTVSISGGYQDCGLNCRLVEIGRSVTLNASPNAGSIFPGFDGVVCGNPQCTFTQYSNYQVGARFLNRSTVSAVVNLLQPQTRPVELFSHGFE